MRTLLQESITFHANRAPESVAVAMQGDILTYGQLEDLTNRLAHCLRAQGCRRGDRICFAIPKSPIAIAAILGILKADCTYVPIDTAQPSSRALKIIQACEARWILATGPAQSLMDELFAEPGIKDSLSVGWLGRTLPTFTNFAPVFSSEDLVGYPNAIAESRNSTEDIAYILFTSGSTGTPKGVPIRHRSVMRYVEWAANYFGMHAADRISGHHPLHFDLSVQDIFGTFAVGAQLHPIPPELNLLPHKLAEFIRAAELTQLFSVPSALNYMAKFDVVRQDDFPKLTRLLWCGEVLPTPTLRYFMQRLTKVQFTNLYGPTEATIASSYYTVPSCPEHDQVPIPIGTPCDGEELLVLNERMEKAKTGEIGDLYIRGIGLSPGYWKDPDKTKAVFLPNPCAPAAGDRIYKTGDLAKSGEDGLVYFLGRADSQIKSRGYRIELGEIETALNTLPMLQESAVVAIQSDRFEGAIICCAYVPVHGQAVTHSAVRKELGRLVPNYMLPARWLVLNALPKNANVKTDRPKLREAFLRQEPPAKVSA